MGRVSKKELAAKPLRYFPHDADALQDEKCQRLVARYGAAGYGRWWMLCERLASCEGHAIPCGDPESDKILANWLMFDTVGELQEFMQFLLCTGLAQKLHGKNGNSPWLTHSLRMDKQAEKIGNLRVTAQNARVKRGKK